jgi:hypothetical protein
VGHFIPEFTDVNPAAHPFGHKRDTEDKHQNRNGPNGTASIEIDSKGAR